MSLWSAAPASLNRNAATLARSSSPTPCAAIWKWRLPSIYAAKPTCSVFDLLLPHLFPRYLKLRPDERLDSLRTGQAQAEQRAFAFQVDMKVKKRAALSLCGNPLRQLRKRNLRRAVLEFVALFRFDHLFAKAGQLIGQLLVTPALCRKQRRDIAVEIALHCHRLPFLSVQSQRRTATDVWDDRKEPTARPSIVLFSAHS